MNSDDFESTCDRPHLMLFGLDKNVSLKQRTTYTAMAFDPFHARIVFNVSHADTYNRHRETIKMPFYVVELSAGGNR